MMRMFMQNIMNRNANNTSSSNRRRQRHQQQHQRHPIVFNNGYNALNSSQRIPTLTASPPPTPSSSLPPQDNSNDLSENIPDYEEMPSSIQHRLFNTIIDVNANNLTSHLHNNFNPNQYYSNFEYESLNIRFFHNEPLNIQNINNEINAVLSSINEREVQNIFNQFQHEEYEDEEFINNTMHANNTTTNTFEIIQQIMENTLHGEYVHYKPILKNNSCPILLTDFLDDDIISIFKFCNHAIHESTFDRYSKTFVKCPLCNHKLF